MKNAFCLTTLAVALIAFATTALATEGVSPGAVDRMAQVNNACPTFSWGMDSGAVAYDLIAYTLPEDGSQQAELTAETEVLYTRVTGSATGWTPSADKCLAPGGRYVWFVRAVNELAGDEVVAASEWSEGRYFTVPAAPSDEEMQRALDVLRRWDAANGSGEESALPAGTRSGGASPTLRRSSGGGGLSDADAGSAAPKSVPTASAAIRGEHPDTSGEKYGVVGTSASSYGAGVAAANLNSGPDLVLDGSADAEPDARLYEWGLERESATDGQFQFINPGAGALNLEVDGTVAATGLDCPDCVTSAEIADLSIAGADLADDAVTGAKIADGTVDSDDLAAGSVTGIKIAAGAVDTSQIRADAVENTQLADNAVTASKIQDGAVRNAELASNAVTTDKIADGTIVAADLADGAVTGAKLAAGAVTGTELADNAVTTAKIASGAVSSTDLAAGAVIGTKLADDAVAARHLEAGAVDSAAILDGTIMNADIGAGQVSTSHYANFSITNDKLFTGAVTTSKIADGTITAEDVDPTGGVYASKSAVYEVTETGQLLDGACSSITARCSDNNDLGLQGFWDFDSDAVRIRKIGDEAWTDNGQPAGFTCSLCNDGPVPESFDCSILCISVPGP